jgi:hypothetical protein
MLYVDSVGVNNLPAKATEALAELLSRAGCSCAPRWPLLN